MNAHSIRRLYIWLMLGLFVLGTAALRAADWPEWPLYGDGSPFEAHVTLGEPADTREEQRLRGAAEACLPATRTASALLLVVEGADGRWETRHELALR